MSLFSQELKSPLAERMRPKTLDDFLGQKAILDEGRYLSRMIKNDTVPSLIFFGPPGTGKTTLAKIIANITGGHFEEVNAVSSGVADLRKVIALAKERQLSTGLRTILFIDEIHRFNKAQQDVLLPFVESGVVTLIGATTENPFFEINSPLLSRMKLVRLESLAEDDIKKIIIRALNDKESGFGKRNISIDDEALYVLAQMAGGDARVSLNFLDQAVSLVEDNTIITRDILKEVLSGVTRRYDKKGDEHYDVISAFIKSMRGSSPDATLHYLARMIEGGEDLKFIARRIVICASEDVGNADPQALVVAMNAANAAQFVGFPEARLPLAQAALYVATAPKSNSSYMGIDMAINDVRSKPCGKVPLHLKDSHYKGAKALGHGKDYKYPHSYENNFVDQQYLPNELKNATYYEPSENGFEKIIKERMNKNKTSK